MTTKTGSTAQTLAGTVTPPTFVEALGGAVLQLSVLLYCWGTQTSFGAACLPDPTAPSCLDDPWGRQVMGTLGLAAFFWLYSLRTLASEGTSDPSIVDRLWSILPWVYCWHSLLSMSPTDAGRPRVLLMTLLCTAWGTRLTFNFWIKGGFSGGEDYRWKEVRS